MALPAALVEANGDKMLPLVYDLLGTNAAAAWRGVRVRDINGDPVAYLGVATHADNDTWVNNDPVLTIGGLDTTTVRAIAVDAGGRLVGRPLGAYDQSGSNAFGHPRLVARATQNGEDVGWLGVASHADATTFAAGSAMMVVGGVDGTTARKAAADSSGRMLVSDRLTLAGQGARAVSVTGSRVQLSGTSIPCRRVRMKAHPANGSIVYIGTSSVTADTAATGGFQLDAGDEVEVEVSDLNLVYVNGSASEGVSYLYWT